MRAAPAEEPAGEAEAAVVQEAGESAPEAEGPVPGAEQVQVPEEAAEVELAAPGVEPVFLQQAGEALQGVMNRIPHIPVPKERQ